MILAALSLACGIALARPDPPDDLDAQVEAQLGSASVREAAARSAVRIVVATFEEQGVPAGMGDVVADMLVRAIDAPGCQLLERRQVRRVLEEQAFAASDLTQPGDAVRYGRLVDTRFVLVGSVYRIDGTYVVSARMVDSVTGVVQESARAVVQFRTVDEMASRIGELARALGLRVGPPLPGSAGPGPAPGAARAPALPMEAAPPPGMVTPAAPETVRDLLERVGDTAEGGIRVEVPGNMRAVREGDDLRFTVRAGRDGFLSLFVVDAEGRVGQLLPNARTSAMPVRSGQAIAVPGDVPFRLRARPPFGPTRVKAVVTSRPMPLVGAADAGDVLRRVELGQELGAGTGAAPDEGVRPGWASSEIEFLVIPSHAAAPLPSGPSPAPAPSPVPVPTPVVPPVPSVSAALERVLAAGSSVDPADAALLRWPLASPLQPGVDIGWSSAPDVLVPPRIAVVDADFDPDDPFLERAFAGLPVAQREELRAEIRRNGRAPFRHGNRVASLIAGEAAWLPACLPGAAVVPVRITTSIDAPGYRAEKGGAAELLAALRSALSAGCRVINLSLSVPLPDEAERRAFASDPVWDDLERAGAVVVCAAGNGREDLDSDPRFPACLDRANVLCVGAVGPDGRIATWGDQGSARGARSVDVMAPGSMIAVSDGGGRAGLADGTSYACAFATAAVARLLAQAPGLSGAAAVDRIVAGAQREPSLAGLCRGGLLRWPDSGN